MARDRSTSSECPQDNVTEVDPEFQARFQTYLNSRADRIPRRSQDNRTELSRQTESTLRSTATQLDGHQRNKKVKTPKKETSPAGKSESAQFSEHRRQHSQLDSAMLQPSTPRKSIHGLPRASSSGSPYKKSSIIVEDEKPPVTEHRRQSSQTGAAMLHPPAAHAATHGSQHASILSYPSTNVTRPQESTVSSYDVELPPRPRRRSSVLSTASRISRISQQLSLTPIDVQLPITQEEDPHRASRILGVEEHTPAHVSEEREIALRTLSGELVFSSTPRVLQPVNGRLAWVHAFAAFLVVFNCWGFSLSFGLYQAYFQRYFLPGISASTISYIGSIQLALVFGLGVPVGQLVDKGYFGLCFHGGSAAMAVGLFGTSFCTSWASLFVVEGIIVGSGMGFVFTSGLICIMGWFDERRLGLAMAIAASGSCVGGICYILLSRHFLLTEGFDTTIRTLSAIAFATMIPPNLIFRMREHGRPRPPSQSRPKFDFKMFYDGAYLFAAAGLFCSFMGLYFGFVYIISYASEVLHLSDDDSINILIYTLTVNLPGRLIPAFISDRWLGPLNTLLFSVILSAIVLYVWLFMSIENEIGHGDLLAISCVYGLVSAGLQSLYASVAYSFCLQPAIATTAGTTVETIDRLGLKAGAIFTCIGIGCLIGTPIGGGLITTNELGEKDFTGAQTFAGVSLTAGFLFLCLARTLKVGLKLKRA